MRAALALIILATLVLTTTSTLLSAATLIVDPDGDGDFIQIQPAIDAAADGDTVLVRPGEYVIVEPIDFNRLDGPVKNIALRSEAGAEATIIRMAEEPADPERASVVIFESGETQASVLEGFTLTGGQGTRRGDSSYQSGGGLFCVDGSSPSIISCILTQNTAKNYGAGVFCSKASPTLTDCQVVQHSGEHRYTVYLSLGSPTLVRCTISDNTAEHGGVSCGSATLEDCTISGNTGSGLSLGGGAPTVTNCTISRNGGAGVRSSGTTGATVTNCTISDNLYGVSSIDDSSPTFTGCTISGSFYNGLRCTRASPTLIECTISRNCFDIPGWSQAAGVYCWYESFPTLIDCVISENGRFGFYLENSSPNLAGCTISRNAGTGVRCTDEASPTLTNCTIRGNSSFGLYCMDESAPTLINCVISENSYGGVHINSSARLAHCTIAGNSHGGVFSNGSEITTTLTHCIIWGNVGGSLTGRVDLNLEVDFCCIQADEVFPGEGNINTDPLFCGFAGPRVVFVDAAAPEGGDGTEESPFHDLAAALDAEYSLSLQEGSPCIGAARDGGNLGADLGTCAGGAPGDRVAQIASGHYRVEGLSLVHLASILGEGPGETVLEGTVEGLGTHATLAHVTVTGGTSGGVLVSDYTSPSIEFCTIRGNSGGPGVSCGSNSSPTLRNCTILGNPYGGVECSAESSPRITSCIVWDNGSASISAGGSASPQVSFSCTQGDEVWPGDENSNQDPLFCAWREGEVHVASQQDFEEALSAPYDPSLSGASPCLGTGEGGLQRGSEPQGCGTPGSPSKTVHLAAGTYRIQGLRLKHHVSLVGAGAEQTVIEGTVHGLQTGDVLSHLTVTHGTEGGVVVGEYESPEISHCTIWRNRGRGVYCGENSSPTVADCTISANSDGGVLCSGYSSPTIASCRIWGNSAWKGGGVTCFRRASARIIQCTISGNARGGLYFEDDSTTIRSCTVSGNSRYGISAGNLTPSRIAGVVNCIDWPLCHVIFDLPEEAHCLCDPDPLFVHNGVFDFTRFTEPVEIAGELVEFPDFIVEPPDFRLQPGSPAIDAGTCDGAPETDIIGTPRPIGAGCDIGAYEYPEIPTGTRFLRGEANADGAIDLSDAVSTLGYLFLGNAKPPCLDAADTDDNGSVELTDAVYLLHHLFLGGPEPPAPYPACGLDLTDDDLTCEAFETCSE